MADNGYNDYWWSFPFDGWITPAKNILVPPTIPNIKKNYWTTQQLNDQASLTKMDQYYSKWSILKQWFPKHVVFHLCASPTRTATSMRRSSKLGTYTTASGTHILFGLTNHHQPSEPTNWPISWVKSVACPEAQESCCWHLWANLREVRGGKISYRNSMNCSVCKQWFMHMVMPSWVQ